MGQDIHWRPDAKQWLRWNGHVWASDRTGEITRDALAAIRTYFADATSGPIAESEKQSFLNAVAGPRGGIAALIKTDDVPVAVMTHEPDALLATGELGRTLHTYAAEVSGRRSQKIWEGQRGTSQTKRRTRTSSATASPCQGRSARRRM